MFKRSAAVHTWCFFTAGGFDQVKLVAVAARRSTADHGVIGSTRSSPAPGGSPRNSTHARLMQG